GLERPDALQALSDVAAAVPASRQPALGGYCMTCQTDHPKIVTPLDKSFSQFFTRSKSSRRSFHAIGTQKWKWEI
ncbi:hypothetical protein OAO87_01720, partial [bacterium]|nr:hypothetical protein [bacterium]